MSWVLIKNLKQMTMRKKTMAKVAMRMKMMVNK
jgi:hypothetical protein